MFRACSRLGQSAEVGATHRLTQAGRVRRALATAGHAGGSRCTSKDEKAKERHRLHRVAPSKAGAPRQPGDADSEGRSGRQPCRQGQKVAATAMTSESNRHRESSTIPALNTTGGRRTVPCGHVQIAPETQGQQWTGRDHPKGRRFRLTLAARHGIGPGHRPRGP
jgi:hypothetical protein